MHMFSWIHIMDPIMKIKYMITLVESVVQRSHTSSIKLYRFMSCYWDLILKKYAAWDLYQD